MSDRRTDGPPEKSDPAPVDYSGILVSWKKTHGDGKNKEDVPGAVRSKCTLKTGQRGGVMFLDIVPRAFTTASSLAPREWSDSRRRPEEPVGQFGRYLKPIKYLGRVWFSSCFDHLTSARATVRNPSGNAE